MPNIYRYLRGAATLLLATVVGALTVIVPAQADTTGSVPPGLRRVTIDELRAAYSANAVQWLYLRNVNSKLFMAVSGGADGDGVAIIQWPQRTGQEQAWYLDINANGYWVIRNGGTTTQKAVTIKDRSSANGAAVVQWNYVGQDNQEFILGDYGDATYDFENRRSLRCLAIPGGSKTQGTALIQWNCNSGLEQRWELYAWG